MSILASVVVPTYRRPQLLNRCLEALLSQDFDPAAYEIIIADDAASPETEDLVRKIAYPLQYDPVFFHEDENQIASSGSIETHVRVGVGLKPPVPPVHYVPVIGTHGPAAARNHGWRAAEGQIIAFTDDDCIPSRDWLISGLRAMRSDVEGVSGRIVVPLSLQPTDYEFDQLGLERSKFITANCFYRKSALEAAGGFDERYRMAWREDTDLYFTLLEQGARLVLSHEPVVTHPLRPAPWGVSIKQQKKTLYNALCYKKHPMLFKENFILRAPPNYYATWLASVLLVAGVVSGQIHWVVTGGISNLLLAFGFAIKRLQGTRHTPAHIAEMLVTSLVIPYLSIFWRLVGAIRYRVLYF